MVKKSYYVGQVFKDLYPPGSNRYYTIVEVYETGVRVRGYPADTLVKRSYRELGRWLGSYHGLQDISFNKYLEAL